MTKKKIWLVQQGVWRAKATDRPPPMPLACGYLKAIIEAEADLNKELDVRIFSLPGGETIVGVMDRIMFNEVPDLIGFSVLGWNYDLFGRVSEVYKRLHPSGWVAFGGTHVANQGKRVFRMFPDVDVVFNGEGEWTFLELLRALLGGVSKNQLENVSGISFQATDGSVITNDNVVRIRDLDQLPSPILTGAINLTNDQGRFKYDSALMETNRGCPYKCSFCYWGGAIGQKVRKFSIDRLADEVEVLAKAGTREIMLCDANFGMLPQDEEFIEICIRARERYGYPQNIMTSWAKDKRKYFYNIVRRMREAGFISSFNLALQSLSDATLEGMQRKNMKINEWKDIADWLHSQGMAVYAELIWGCPGETYDSFLEGYDELARHVSRIATYPLLMLPNTHYLDNKEEHELVTWQVKGDDFGRILQHKTMSIQENQNMHGFLFWARVIAEHLLFQHIWSPLDRLVKISQSDFLLSLDNWLRNQSNSDPAARRICEFRDHAVSEFDVGAECIENGLQFFFCDKDADDLLDRWWAKEIIPRIKHPGLRGLLTDIFRYDCISRPIYDVDSNISLPVVQKEGQQYYWREGIGFEHDISGFIIGTGTGNSTIDLDIATAPGISHPIIGDFYYKKGFCNDMALYHNAQNNAYFALVDWNG